MDEEVKRMREAGIENGDDKCPYPANALSQFTQEMRELLDALDMAERTGDKVEEVAGVKQHELNRANEAYKRAQQLVVNLHKEQKRQE